MKSRRMQMKVNSNTGFISFISVFHVKPLAILLLLLSEKVSIHAQTESNMIWINNIQFSDPTREWLTLVWHINIQRHLLLLTYYREFILTENHPFVMVALEIEHCWRDKNACAGQQRQRRWDPKLSIVYPWVWICVWRDHLISFQFRRVFPPLVSAMAKVDDGKVSISGHSFAFCSLSKLGQKQIQFEFRLE